MPFLHILGPPEVIASLKTDGDPNNQFWQVDEKKSLGEQLGRLRNILRWDSSKDFTLHKVEGGSPGSELNYEIRIEDLEKSKEGKKGIIKEIWVQPREVSEESHSSVPMEQVADVSTDEGDEVQMPHSPPRVPETMERERWEDRSTTSRYEAAGLGWAPFVKTTKGERELIELPLQLEGGKSAVLCRGCSAAVLRGDPASVLWSEVGRHLAPILPNTAFKEGSVHGKLTFARGGDGRWRPRSLGATWKDRLFRITPTGLHYYSSAAFTAGGKDVAPKNSKIFTPETELIEDPSAAEFVDLQGKGVEYFYFGLKFKKPEEVLMMRVKDRADRDSWVSFLSTTLKQLQTTLKEKWVAKARPPPNKQASSSYLCRIAEYRELASRALEEAERDRQAALAAERQMAADRAEMEHMGRLVDRGEGEVARMMAAIREMRIDMEAKQSEARANRDAAIRMLSEAQKLAGVAKAKQAEAADSAAEMDSTIEKTKRQIQLIKEETERHNASCQQAFSKWRKIEEFHCKQKKTKPAQYYAFSPADNADSPSPYSAR